MKARHMHLTMWYAGHKPHDAKIAGLDRRGWSQDYGSAKMEAAHRVAYYLARVEQHR